MTSTYTLSMLGLPNVRDLAGLADETALSQGLLYKLSVASDRYYCRFDLPKKGGGQVRFCEEGPVVRLNEVVL